MPSEVPIDPTFLLYILESDQPKDFWRYVKSRRTDSTGVKPLKVNNELFTMDKDKAEALVVHPEGPHLEGRRPETSRASGE